MLRPPRRRSTSCIHGRLCISTSNPVMQADCKCKGRRAVVLRSEREPAPALPHLQQTRAVSTLLKLSSSCLPCLRACTVAAPLQVLLTGTGTAKLADVGLARMQVCWSNCAPLACQLLLLSCCNASVRRNVWKPCSWKQPMCAANRQPQPLPALLHRRRAPTSRACPTWWAPSAGEPLPAGRCVLHAQHVQHGQRAQHSVCSTANMLERPLLASALAQCCPDHPTARPLAAPGDII